MKVGDRYKGVRDGARVELEIQEGPFRVTHAGHPVEQVRVKITEGPQAGEPHQWGVRYIVNNYELVE